MRGVAGRRLAAMASLAVLAAGVFLVSRVLAAKGLNWATSVTTVASAVLAAITLLLPLLGKLLGGLRGARPVAAISLRQARAGLAATLAKQWEEEDRLRRVYDPWPLPVRWQSAGIETTEPFAGIYQAFTRTPARRLVILGAAGAGKSVLAIKLVRDLLAAWGPDDRVPVLLPAATWTRDCAMTEWITEQLALSQPSLDVRIGTDTGDQVSLPRALVDSGVIPVIDGLDELPQARRAAVIAEINAYGSEYPLVLTSRPEEYHDAVTARGVSRAVVIELKPLAAADVKKYLTDSTDAPASRWQPVLGRLDAEPGGALAQALATPLMIWLARTVYQSAGSRPAELIEPARSADREAIESHLVAAFVPAVYSRRWRRSRPRSFRCGPAQATRWLGFLAYRLDRSRTQEITWWRLPLAEPAFLIVTNVLRAVLYTCTAWLVTVWALTRRGYWRDGGYVGHGRYQDLLLAGPLGRAVRPLTNAAVRSLFKGLNLGTVHHASSDVDAFLRGVAHLGLFTVACLAACFGMLAAVVSLIRKHVPAPETLRPTWRSPLRLLVNPPAWIALVAFFWGYAAVNHRSALAAAWPSTWRWVLLWLVLILAGDLARSMREPVQVAAQADAVSLLRADRRAYLAGKAGRASAVGRMWLWAGGVLAAADGIWVAAGLLVVLVLGSTSGAWVSYLDARLRLAVRGRLPWRTISFLNDAHRSGVLRQAGAAYQFRHIRLQDQLAAGYSPWPRPLQPAAVWAGQRLARLRPLMSDLIERAPRADQGVAGGTTEYRADGADWPISPLWSPDVILLAASAVGLCYTAVFVIGGVAAMLLLFLVAALLIILAAVLAVNRVRARAQLPSGSWSIRVTPAAIELTVAAGTIRLTADDVDLIAVRPIGNDPICSALQARLRPGSALGATTQDGWLPLFWTPLYTSRIPRALVAVLAACIGDRLEARLAFWIRRGRGPDEFEASGSVEITSISATLGRFRIAVPALLVLAGLCAVTDQGGLAALVVMAIFVAILICWYRLAQRAVKRKLPPGPWSLRVRADAIEVTRAGRGIELSPDDVETITFRSIRGTSVSSAVYARLRPEAAARLDVADGWFPIYWAPDLMKNVPGELAMLLAEFAPERLARPLRRKAGATPSPWAPVYRDLSHNDSGASSAGVAQPRSTALPSRPSAGEPRSSIAV